MKVSDVFPGLPGSIPVLIVILGILAFAFLVVYLSPRLRK